MQYKDTYESPLGSILLASDDEGLIGLWFFHQKYFANILKKDAEQKEIEPIRAAKEWLDQYFSGNKPSVDVPLHFIGTDFQKEVWNCLLTIPYGHTTTYGEIAQHLAEEHGGKKVSAQAVGGAVGHNEMSIIVPCHRVVGSNGSLTGYAGGIQRKMKLLELEGVDLSKFSVPTSGTAL